MTRKAAVLISVKPRFAEAILDGSKTVELRRRGIDAHANAAVVIYASSPTMAIVGTARLAEIAYVRPSTAWRRFHHTLGISREEFDAYLDGCATAVLLHLTKPQRLDKPITLAQLRSRTRFHPPQSYRYVAVQDPSQLRRLVHTA